MSTVRVRAVAVVVVVTVAFWARVWVRSAASRLKTQRVMWAMLVFERFALSSEKLNVGL
jgi:hypothetical protein